jgi:hypothetical protein
MADPLVLGRRKDFLREMAALKFAVRLRSCLSHAAKRGQYRSVKNF